MAKSNKDAESRGCVKVGGREYVNLTVFANRVGVRQQAVSYLVKVGKLTRKSLDGYKGQWLDWEISRARFVRMRNDPHKQGGSRKRTDAKVITDTTGVGEVRPIPVPVPSTVGSEMVGVTPLGTSRVM